MYKWYKNAACCFAYLADVPSRNSASDEDYLRAFWESSWFKRAWTLPELLAPREIVFCDAGWNEFGMKVELAEHITAVTGIPERYLRDEQELEHASIAAKMSWASKRETTRVEDAAYSLIGLFNVNMPILYGEGERAFMRLQLEIIKKSDDESIFAWTRQPTEAILSGMLAPSPQAFQKSGSVQNDGQHLPAHGQPYEMTNKGLKIRMPAYDDPDVDDARAVAIRLRCSEGNRPLKIPLTPTKDGRWLTIRDEALREADQPSGEEEEAVNTRLVIQRDL